MQIWLDSADPNEYDTWGVEGFTTNPLLFARAGADNYEKAARACLDATDKPVCIEILAFDGDDAYTQARKIYSWAPNAVIKVPAHARYQGCIGRLVNDHVPLNLTCITSLVQATTYAQRIPHADIISVFAGRIADTGRDPFPMVQALTQLPMRVLWGSVREPLNIAQAREANCDIITVPFPILQKHRLWENRDLDRLAEQTIDEFTEAGVGWSL